ncbi:Bcr/CflA family efflux MFS transporter [Virgibacillus dakarensis]|uniref:Bcr/CflA family efflux transporter n=1 Tax=Lentibacillus populi TaxID=1827502 RepID=A0A9W5U1N3_9BACI|nr:MULTISPECIES: multidrug effflux MFS transporter [Bacillaceae]MTW87340.1 Bcr/CflA family efflux MFS transporter [Virgibacillus dakarensis]GGB61184.1 Bcr/CflA family drug resistance efflux transporter [Lentibacillus populi]
MNEMERMIDSQETPKRFNKVWMVLILGFLTAFGPLSMDMYLPALPIVTDDLQTTASLGQLSITACLLGLAVGQLLFGPLSDIQGRKRPLVITLVIYAIASLLCAFSSNIWLFIGLRFIQGFSGAAGIVIARASARDMYVGKDLTQFIALLALVNGAAPILAPLFGGVVLNWVSWNAVFVILCLIGFIMFLAVIFTLPETLPIEKRAQGGLLETVKTFRDLLKDRVFMGIALAQAFASMSMFAYIAGSPFVLQNIYGITPQQFSIVFAVNGVGIIIAAQLTGRLAHKIEEAHLLHVGVSISCIGSCLLLAVVLFSFPLWVLLPALFLVVASVGIVNTTSFSLGMQRQGKVAGSASAFLGILPFGGGGIVSPLVGIGGDHTAVPMGIVIFICSVTAFIIYMTMVKRNRAIIGDSPSTL